MPSTTAPDQSTTPAVVTTRVVAIGASAGGLTALEQFLEHTPSNTGMAYIVVQHLDPTRNALLTNLLQRSTEMHVLEAKQGMRIKPNCVYVIAPNTELSLLDDKLNVMAPSEPRGLRLPVNVLFSSLAGVQGNRAIAVILSGMGSDGTLGIQAIKALGGLTVVQEPTSAQFNSMPQNAIDTGCVDIIAPAAELPPRILSYIDHVTDPVSDVMAVTQEPTTSNPMELIIRLLQQHTRHDFSLYKSSTLHRRIARRMAIYSLDSLTLYAEFLKHNVSEIDLLFKELLIGVTSFFRDPETWDYLAEVALPELLTRQPKQPHLRVWSVGCSTGEEAYSLAIVFNEALQCLPQSHKITVQIIASDLSTEAIAIARRGVYPHSIDTNVSPERLARFFTKHEEYYQVNDMIRNMVLFATHDVVLDPPFTRLDLISCRNLLIYFDPQLQNRLIPLFHYSLRPGGILLLGSSETVGRSKHLFSLMQDKLRIYQRQEHTSTAKPDLLLDSFPPLSKFNKETHVNSSKLSAQPPDNLQTAADRVLLQVYAPAAVVLNNDADIIYISGRTGKYLEPAAGKANWNFHVMIRDSLRASISAAIRQSGTQADPIHLHKLPLKNGDKPQRVDVTVQALHEPAVLKGMTMIIFRDISTSAIDQGPEKIGTVDSSHAAALQQHQEEIHALREEARASREELQSSNEELQSTNEELQSTNEELTTSKEEMQSMNEELQTINNELQNKLDELSLAQSDIKNILNSVEIAILFLDQKLQVRRYTEQASKIINLRESDIGRPLSDLTTRLNYSALHEDAVETLRTLVSTVKQITSEDNRWFSVHIIPYRRIDNMIDGVVMTLVDITDTKLLELQLRDESNL